MTLRAPLAVLALVGVVVIALGALQRVVPEQGLRTQAGSQAPADTLSVPDPDHPLEPCFAP
jgi:hypothetical protein